MASARVAVANQDLNRFLTLALRPAPQIQSARCHRRGAAQLARSRIPRRFRQASREIK